MEREIRNTENARRTGNSQRGKKLNCNTGTLLTQKKKMEREIKKTLKIPDGTGNSQRDKETEL